MAGNTSDILKNLGPIGQPEKSDKVELVDATVIDPDTSDSSLFKRDVLAALTGFDNFMSERPEKLPSFWGGLFRKKSEKAEQPTPTEKPSKLPKPQN